VREPERRRVRHVLQHGYFSVDRACLVARTGGLQPSVKLSREGHADLVAAGIEPEIAEGVDEGYLDRI
jgi:uncharacterized protein (AIM24 family)